MNKYSPIKYFVVFVAAAIVSCNMSSKENDTDSTSAKDAAASKEIQKDGNDTVNLKTGKHMAQVKSKDGTLIAFEKKGSGPALIIVSGALSQRDLFTEQSTSLVDMLSKHFTVYVYDRRGRGESTNVQPYSVDREIEDIDALIENAGGETCLYGVSSGGALSLQAAAKLGPNKVEKLAIYEAPYGQGAQAFEKQKQGVNERVKSGQPGNAAAFFLAEIGTPAKAIEGMKSSPQWETIKKIDFTLVYDYQVLGDGAIPQAVVKTISIPTLVMAGEKAMDFISASASQMAKLIPNARYKILKGQTHQAEAAVVAPVLIEFFSRAAVAVGRVQ